MCRRQTLLDRRARGGAEPLRDDAESGERAVPARRDEKSDRLWPRRSIVEDWDERCRRTRLGCGVVGIEDARRTSEWGLGGGNVVGRKQVDRSRAAAGPSCERRRFRR